MQTIFRLSSDGSWWPGEDSDFKLMVVGYEVRKQNLKFNSLIRCCEITPGKVEEILPTLSLCSRPVPVPGNLINQLILVPVASQ